MQNRFRLVCFGVAAALPAFALAQSGGPELKQIFPAGARAGESLSVTVLGSNLEKARYFASHSGIAFTEKEGELTATVAGDVPPGLYDVRALTGKGLSGPRRFLVGDQPEILEVEENDTPETAQVIPLPGVVWGKFDKAADVDCYRFSARSGQQLTIECRSASLDQEAEPVLGLIGPRGTELLHSSAHQREPKLHVELPETGEYVLRVMERAYRTHKEGNAYRIALITGPRLVAGFPHALVRGESHPVTLYGYELPQGTPVTAAASEQPAEGGTATRPLEPQLQRMTTTVDAPHAGEPDVGFHSSGAWLEGFHYRMPGIAGACRFGLADGPLTVESEEETSRIDVAQPLSLPAGVVGWFRTKREVDWYRFKAKKGEKLAIDSFGERLGGNLDLELGLHDKNGKLLTTLSGQGAPKGWPDRVPFATPDAGGVWEAPADGEYRLAVRDLFGGSVAGLDRIYRFTVGPPKPDFIAMALHPDEKASRGVSIEPGKKSTVQLILWRFGGFDGPVTVRASDLPEGLSAADVQIGKGAFSQNMTFEVEKEFSLPADQPLVRLQLHAEGEIDDSQRQRPVRALTLIRPGPPPLLRITDGPVLAILGLE